MIYNKLSVERGRPLSDVTVEIVPLFYCREDVF